VTARLPIVTPRACDDCTACCTTMAVPELAKPSGTPCPHLTASGCGIYAERPVSCRHFRCAWLARDSALLTTALRPDRSGLVVWQERTRHGVTVVAQETRAGASRTGRAPVLLRELAVARPLVVRDTAGAEESVSGPGASIATGGRGS
jgi:hypothetical protein